jgi:hypothetical protein
MARPGDAPESIDIRPDDALKNLLQTLNFPVSRETVIRERGNTEIWWNREEPIMLEDVMREIHQDNFRDLTDLQEAILSNIRLAFGDYSAQNEQSILES